MKKKRKIYLYYFSGEQQTKKRSIPGEYCDIFSKRQRNILYAGRDVENPLCIDICSSHPFLLRERIGRLPFSRVALGKRHNCSFSPQPLSPLNPCPSVSKHFVNHLSVARVVRKLELGRRSHQFTTHNQKKLIFRRNEIGRIKKGI